MEYRAKFDLNQKLQYWKNQLKKSNSFTDDNIEELESHVLDEMTSLQKNGLNEEESFIISQKRLGPTSIIKEEFQKVNTKMNFRIKILPYLNGILCYVIIRKLIYIIQTCTILLAANNISLKSISKQISQNELIQNYIPFILVSLILITLLTLAFLSYVVYRYKKNEIFKLKFLSNTPVLNVILLILVLTELGTMVYFANFMKMEVNLLVLKYSYSALLFIALIVSSSLIYFRLKKENQLLMVKI